MGKSNGVYMLKSFNNTVKMAQKNITH